ncbi:PREDICTED: putative gustatory receptor 28a [Trachymyrmex cornetzi]|uniref:putative gustatory receptor 28a n=1 Tax=Trachymyrmex cornetzi TaxID=471704 RepID=UPI00084F4674|nr:PREDICTED: putative gustatory receptor 28a [Trachymyrmex cornetzi]
MINMSLKFRRCTECKMWKKWQLFHATDFQSLMHPCFTFCRILGIFPYRINASTFETTKQRSILATVIIGILCIYELGVLCRINIIGTIKFDTIALAFERNCFFTLSGFIAIVTYILNGSRMHLLQNIMEISLRLPPDSYRKLSKLIHAKDIFGFFFLIGQATFYRFVLEFNNMDKIFILYMNLIILQMDMLYINCVCVLKACFKEINDNLANLEQVVMNDEPHLLRRIYHKQKNPFLLMKLKALRKQHLITSDAVQMLNTIFSPQLLATIVITFSELTFLLYFYIFHWKIDTKNVNHKLLDWLLLTSLMYQCIKIALMGWACDTGKDEAMRIGTTVHEILNDTIDEQIKDELQLFSLQVLQRENTFSAKGLIVDATLLVGIVSNITTYLLILIQFLITDQVCNKITNNIT